MYQKTVLLAAFFYLLTLEGGVVVAQKLSKVDSLKQELGLGPDSNRYKVLYGLAWELFDVENHQALVYAEHAYELALKKGDSLEIVKSGRIMGQLLRRVDRLDESIVQLEKMSAIARRNRFNEEMRKLLSSLALAHTYRANYDKALEYNFEALVLNEKEGDKKRVSNSLLNIGLTYYKMGNYDLSLEHYLQSLRIKQEIGDESDLTVLYIDIGLCYNEMHSYDRAQEYLEIALKKCGSACEDDPVRQAEFGLGNALMAKKKFREAIPHYEKSLEISLKLEDGRYTTESYLALGKISVNIGDLTKTRYYLDQLDKMKEKGQYRELLKSYYRLQADYFAGLGDFEKSNFYLRKVQEQTDSIFSASVIRNISKVQAKMDQRENLRIIAAQDEVLRLNEERIRQQRTLNWLLIFIVAITSVSGYTIYRNYKKIRAVNNDLATAKKVIEEQNQMLDKQVQEKTMELQLTNETLQKVNEELDNFIYKTSHDIRGPLASLKGIVNLAIMDVKDDRALNYLHKLDLTAERLNMILTRLLIVNRINHAELRPEPIHFEPIIQEILLLEMKKGVPSKIRIDYEVDHTIRFVSDREMVRLILENLIDNAVKFYNESERIDSFVHISVNNVADKVVVSVRDNGVGVSEVNREKIFQMFVRASERSETGGIGLYLAKIATEKLFGEISLHSAEKLTEFQVAFPTDLQAVLEKKRREKVSREVRQDLKVLTVTEASPKSS
ncbi:MAG: tetratricopeptide repeat-containing sensor histidine kinase [Bacteroidetes bacterium]|nr:tetratricopeptide repeat-containing sensor histidine kinase [Bacteroidota bacterium]